jgi:hypothetical protein
MRAVGDVGCGLVSNVIATAGGTASAGASTRSGRAAVAVGVRRYKALSAGLKLVCGSFFNGNTGKAMEGHREAAVASDIVNPRQVPRVRTKHGRVWPLSIASRHRTPERERAHLAGAP